MSTDHPNHSLPKAERLSSIRVIDDMFRHGQHVFSYPYKLQYLILSEETTPADSAESSIVFSVTVPKKLHKKAVHRNHLKRLTRESYRLHKPEPPHSQKNVRIALMYIYVAKDILPYAQIEKAMIKVNRKLVAAMAQKSS